MSTHTHTHTHTHINTHTHTHIYRHMHLQMYVFAHACERAPVFVVRWFRRKSRRWSELGMANKLYMSSVISIELHLISDTYSSASVSVDSWSRITPPAAHLSSRQQSAEFTAYFVPRQFNHVIDKIFQWTVSKYYRPAIGATRSFWHVIIMCISCIGLLFAYRIHHCMPVNKLQRSWISWCPTLGFQVAL